MKKEFAIKTNVPTKTGLEYQPIETFKSVVDGITPTEMDNIFVDFRGVTTEMITKANVASLMVRRLKNKIPILVRESSVACFAHKAES